MTVTISSSTNDEVSVPILSPPPEHPSKVRSILASSAVLTTTMLAASAGNYVLNAAMARMLSPSEFGDANLAVNLVLAVAAIAATLQLVTARTVGAHPESIDEIRRVLLKRSLAVGIGLAMVFTLGASWATQVFKTSSPHMFMVIGAGLPIYLRQAVHRGVLQGQVQIHRLAASYGAEAAIRVLGGLLLIWVGFGVTGAAIAISLSFVASGMVAKNCVPFVTKRACRIGKAGSGRVAPLGPNVFRQATLGALVLLIGQVIINNGDVLASKTIFSSAEAGAYAAVALIGRALFFLTWSIAHAVFPVAAKAETSDSDKNRALITSLGLVITLCFLGVSGLQLYGEQILSLVVGAKYANGAELLVPYAIATSLFAIANLIATFDMARGRIACPVALLVGAVLQTVLVFAVGTTPIRLVEAQIVAMLVTVVLTTSAYVLSCRAGSSAYSPKVFLAGE